MRISTLLYANGFTMWHCRANDSIEQIEQDTSYFGNMWAVASVGDIIYITTQGRTYTRQIIEITENTVKIGE